MFIDLFLVAIQCLEQAFNVVASNTSTELDCGRSLLEIFTDVVKVCTRSFALCNIIHSVYCMSFLSRFAVIICKQL